MVYTEMSKSFGYIVQQFIESIISILKLTLKLIKASIWDETQTLTNQTN